MLRHLHSLPGLIAAVLLAVLAITGAVLSLDPVVERAGATMPQAGQISVAQSLAEKRYGERSGGRADRANRFRLGHRLLFRR